MLGYSIILLFVLSSGLSLLEKYIGKYKLPIYIALGLTLILLSGFKEVGIDPDAENYEQLFRNSDSKEAQQSVEYSFIIIANILKYFSNDVHVLFLFYALLGITLKFFAFRNLSEMWFLPIVVYLSYYYEMHDVVQIRTSVLSGLFLLSIKPLCEGKRLIAASLIVCGAFFHYSAIVLIPTLFLSNKEMSVKNRLIWASLIPVGYIFYYVGLPVLLNMSTSIPYIGNKLALYQAGTEKGIVKASANVFSPLQLYTTLLYFYLMYFYDTIVKTSKYFTLMMKIFTLSLFAFTAFSILPVFAQRVSMLLQVVSIILYANISYTLLPKWAGILAVILVAFVFLNYGLPFVDTYLLWRVK